MKIVRSFLLILLFFSFSVSSVFAQNSSFSCPSGTVQVGSTADTGCPLCRHSVTGEIFSAASCSTPAVCYAPTDCVGLDSTCPAGETFVRWACSTTDSTGSHCVKYCSGNTGESSNQVGGNSGDSSGPNVPVGGDFQSKSNEVRTRVGNPTAPPGSVGNGEVPSARPNDYRQALVNEFGITMNGFSNEQNMWAWEFMHKVSDTRLPEYVRGTVVGVNDSGSYQAGCKEIYLRSTYNTQDLFTVIFTHEMGHVVYHCSEGGNTQRRQAHLEALRVEGPVSSYGRQMCYYGGDTSALETENWAEMVAAYLNPNSLTYAACSADPNPFANGGYPMHYAVAQEIFSK